MLYLIQGIFFQNQGWLSTAMRPIEGAIAVIRQGLLPFMYSGLIWRDPDGLLGEMIGVMEDRFGESELTKIHISNSGIRFEKKYVRGESERAIFEYNFTKKDGNTWVGRYRNPQAGVGVTRCVITEVSEDFLSPEAAMHVMSMKNAHKWPK